MDALERAKADLIAEDQAPVHDVIPMPHPHQLYRARGQALMDGISSPESGSEEIEQIQSMTERMIVTPLGDGFDIR